MSRHPKRRSDGERGVDLSAPGEKVETGFSPDRESGQFSSRPRRRSVFRMARRRARACAQNKRMDQLGAIPDSRPML